MAQKAGTESGSTAYACRALPEGYDLYKRIDLTKDRNSLVAINIWNLAVALAMILPMLFVHPIEYAFYMETGKVIFCFAASIVGMIVYVFLHESIHGIFIRLFTGTLASFGLDIKHGMAHASSSWYFRKWPYIIIALSPVVIWGAVLGLLLKDVQETYFWYLYIIQIFNVMGAAGDLYVTCAVCRMPKNILIFDNGAAMDFYREIKS